MEYATKLALEIYLWFCLAALVLYLPRIFYYFFAFKKQKRLINSKKNKIAVIVPARNESAIIGHCLDSLVAQTYDPQYFDIHIVVPNNNDPSIEIAASYERTYVTVVREQTCKGSALDGVLKRILAETPDKYDAFLIVDADNLAAPDLLEEMNNALSSGKQIICGKKLIKNWQSRHRNSRSFVANCTALTYTQVDDLGNRARNVLGATIAMIGTGMMVRADVIKENDGWPYRSLTEDYEMTADAIVKDWTSMYYSHAKVYTEEATDFKTAFKRRMRWVKGYTQCKRKYCKKIAEKKFPHGKKWQKFGFLYGRNPAYLFFSLSVVAMLCGLIAIGFSLFGQSVSLAAALRLALIPFSLVYGSLFVFTLLTISADWRNIKIPLHEKLAILFFNPLYNLGYFRIFIAAFVTNYDYFKWKKTDRIPFELSQISNLTLMIMAAGMGSRFGGIKQIEPIGPNGELIIDYSIYDAKAAGFNEIVFIINKKIKNAFKKRIYNRVSKTIKCKLVFQELGNLPAGFELPDRRVKPWGTAHAILSAKDAVKNPFAVINADDFYGKDAFVQAAMFLRGLKEGSKDEYCNVTYELKNTISEHGEFNRGICEIDNGCLIKVTECLGINANTQLDPNTLVSMNFWGFTPCLFDRLQKLFQKFLIDNHDNIIKAEYPIPTAIGDLLIEQTVKVKAFKSHDQWVGFTYKEDKETVKHKINNMIKDGKYPHNLT